MEIKSATFVKSSAKVNQCPPPNLPEYAFIGRSNVGKSSLINMLTKKKGLAKTSSTPGKTQTLNHFIINENWYLVDLPGYGYAKVSKTERAKWQQTLKAYLDQRPNLMCVMVLVDSRIPPQKSDIEFINQLGTDGIPLCVVYTKTDKLASRIIAQNIEVFEKELYKYWDALPLSFYTSAEKKVGRDELLTFIEATNTGFANPVRS